MKVAHKCGDISQNDLVNIMAGDDLAKPGARASAAMLLT